MSKTETLGEFLGLMLEAESLREARAMFELFFMETQLAYHQENVTKTAWAIGMDRSAFHRKLKGLRRAFGEPIDG